MEIFIILGGILGVIGFLTFRLIRRDDTAEGAGNYIYVQSASIIGAAGMMNSPTNSEAMAIVGGMSPFSSSQAKPSGTDSGLPF